MSKTPLESLKDGIARNSAAVLSLPSAGMLRHHKTRFLAEDSEGLWVESVPPEGPLLDELIAGQSLVGVACNGGTSKIVFTTTIRRRQGEYRINAQTVVEALLLTMPEEVKTVQRRAHYRVRIPADVEMSVRAWRIPEHFVLSDRPSATLEVPIETRDLSAGGVGLVCVAKGQEPAKMIQDQRLRIVINYEQIEVLVEGRAKHLRPLPNGNIQVGVQFKKLENDLNGRQTLSKLTAIVGDLQRREVRRMRLGLA